MIRVNIEKNNKDWQIIEDNEAVIKATRPKWYSSELRFFYNGKTYQLKKKNFWKSTIEILQGGQLIGSITNSFMTGYQVCLLYTSPSPRDGLLSRMPSSA